MGLLGIAVGLLVLVGLAYRGWSVLLLAPAAAIIASAAAGEPLLAQWTQTFMPAAGRFFAQFFPLFLLGAVFGKLMDDSGSIRTIAAFVSERLGVQRAMLAVVVVAAVVTYGGVSAMVAFFVIAPMAHALFQAADIPRRLMPAAIGLGTFTFTMSALPGSPALQNAIPMPYFDTTLFAAPGLGLLATAVMLGFGLWWLAWAQEAARRRGTGYGHETVISTGAVAGDQALRERAATAREFDLAEMQHGKPSKDNPTLLAAVAPLAVVLLVNLLMTIVVLPGLDTAFLKEPRWGSTSLAAVGGVWSVVVALAAGIAAMIALNFPRLPGLRETIDAGANASVLPIVGIASLVGFGAVVATLPAFELVKSWVLGIGGGPLLSLAVSVNVLAALTGSASGGLTIALDALGSTFMQIAAAHHIDPALLHRVAVMASGTLDAMPHNGAVVALLGVCGTTHREAYGGILMTVIVGPVIALLAVLGLGSIFGSF